MRQVCGCSSRPHMRCNFLQGALYVSSRSWHLALLRKGAWRTRFSQCMLPLLLVMPDEDYDPAYDDIVVGLRREGVGRFGHHRGGWETLSTSVSVSVSVSVQRSPRCRRPLPINAALAAAAVTSHGSCAPATPSSPRVGSEHMSRPPRASHALFRGWPSISSSLYLCLFLSQPLCLSLSLVWD